MTNEIPKKVGGDNIEVTIGDHSSSMAVGKNVQQVIGVQPQVEVTEADIAAVRDIFAELKHQIEAQSPLDKKSPAMERVGELEEAVIAAKPNLTTMEYVKNWFEKHLPQMAGAIVSVLVNPIVGKVVEATGELAAGELKRRFAKG